MDAVSGPSRREATNARAGRGAAADEGVLGNLPRSRPGQRSDKRGARPGAPTRPTESGPAAAARPPSPDLQSAAASTASGGGARGPVGEAAHLAGRAARLGLDVAGGVLKRLPRP